MAEHGLTATALSSYYDGVERSKDLLLGLGGWTPRRIGTTTQLLGDVLRHAT